MCTARSIRRRSGALLLGSAAALGCCLIGCDQEAEIKAQINDSFPSGFIQTKVSVKSAKIKGKFERSGEVVSVECEITVIGTVDGKKVVKTVQAKLSAKGTKGGEYELDCSDPLIVQFPADAINFRATAFDGAAPIPLPLTAGLASVPILPGVALEAEPGMQLVVIEYPPGMPAGFYDLSLDFDLAFSRDIEVKPIITGKIVCGGDTYLPPVAPQVTSMADVPSIVIPAGVGLVEVLPDISSLGAAETHIDCGGGCYADCNDDGALDFFDFLCYQNLFAASDPDADCDGSGALDFFDFLCYQNAFAAGCP